jgi:hypothetical protein
MPQLYQNKGVPMRKKTVLVMATVAVVMMLFPTNNAIATGSVTYYTVRYACQVSPDQYGVIVGQWTVDCDGNWTGSGWMPGEYCTYTDTTYGEVCGGGGGGDPRDPPLR